MSRAMNCSKSPNQTKKRKISLHIILAFQMTMTHVGRKTEKKLNSARTDSLSNSKLWLMSKRLIKWSAILKNIPSLHWPNLKGQAFWAPGPAKFKTTQLSTLKFLSKKEMGSAHWRSLNGNWKRRKFHSKSGAICPIMATKNGICNNLCLIDSKVVSKYTHDYQLILEIQNNRLLLRF